ncbi:MAG: hypothetical protein IT379_28510, partial [Deltaproteobacteria bacterium]|nr:hypothetical protein [Deltaproteobacteria bacterium]
MTEAPPRKPSLVAAVLAALPPLLFPAMAFMLLLILVQGTPVGSITAVVQNAGIWGYVVLGAAALAALVCAALLVLAGRGRRVPAAVTVGAAALPWVLGLVGMEDGMRIAEKAIASADAVSRPSLMAVGVSEAGCARLLGLTLGGALLAAVAVGLGIVAVGQRAPNRRSLLGALLGLVTGAVWLGAIGIAMKTRGSSELTDLVLLAALPACAGLFACALAGAGAGADEPHGRSGALSAAAPVAAILACVGGAASVISIGAVAMLRVLAMDRSTDAMTRDMTIAYGIDRMFGAARVAELATWLGLVPAIALAAWACTRRRPSRGHLAAGVALVATAGAVLLLDRVTVGHAEDAIDEVNAAPGAAVEGFSPILIDDGDFASRTTLVASSAGLSFGGGAAPMPWSDVTTDAGRARLVARFRRQRPTTAIAFDRRVSGAKVRALLRVAAEAGITRVDMVGAHEDTEPGDGVSLDEIGRALPLVAAVRRAPAHLRFQLDSAVPATAADTDRTLLHAIIRGPAAPRLETRTGQTYERPVHVQDCFGGAYDDGRGDRLPRAWIGFTDDVTAN